MASWRQLDSSDITGVMRVADTIHAALPENEHVFAERIALFPEGCLGLVENGEICGYAISFPIRRREPPALNGILGEIAPDADQYYVHDVCVLPMARGRGFAALGIGKLLAIAERYPSACLVSVYGTASFWGRYGFLPPSNNVSEVLLKKVRGYGDEAVYLEREIDQ
ncbi:hypothetical protein BKA67DRAFT_536945 [Truncatella angustata]|uniref:N-acetyltransferase domain-containing protein n=1 Tax=Truncatella angustata TaxID=152316 RepID=A0A9P8UJE4_9PEZI|nr:uncharacterized protein BKA67DRAFT_536945 [Truncatella angustata]KAH6653259.1 hypothetical protein BKA67DRAFT_536945 [Truncatella angustata]KAH8193796.1 hypothetical protein TruAng_012040 [Truncatella angustata]